MKKSLILLSLALLLNVSCEESTPVVPYGKVSQASLSFKKYNGDLAVSWMKLQMTLSRTTPGFGPGPATRAFAYSGLTMYESIVEGMPGCRSVASGLIGQNITARHNYSVIYWPASANAAMATILRNLIPTATAAGKAKIDSLEAVFNAEFSSTVSSKVLENSVAYGTDVANRIFEWAKTDGVAEAGAKNSTYVVPTGFGLWIPTPPAFVSPPVNAFLSEARTFIPGSLALTLPPPPTTYSEDVGSPFYNMVNQVYTISQSLSANDILTVKTWGEFPGNYTNALRYVQIAIQLADDADLSLPVAAVAFAKHGLATQEAVACVFNAKYTYNQMRPISYIRNVMGFTTWNAVNTTPPHPEYPAAHACVGRASSRALESIFGENYSFDDRTHHALYGTRHYSTLKAYSDEAGWSRVLGGIHYIESVDAGSVQGEKVGDLINALPFPDTEDIVF